MSKNRNIEDEVTPEAAPVVTPEAAPVVTPEVTPDVVDDARAKRFEALLVQYAKQNPTKYAEKKARGEFDKIQQISYKLSTNKFSMDTTKNIVIAALVAGFLTATVFWVGRPIQVVTVEQPAQGYGAISSPDIMSPYFSVGGVRHWAGHTEALTAATTTVCAIQSPAATSTLLHAGIRLSTSSTTASTVTLSKGATAYATTTLIGQADVAANAPATIIASTSPATAGALTFGPSQWFVVGMQGNTGTFSPEGVCQAEWIAF